MQPYEPIDQFPFYINVAIIIIIIVVVRQIYNLTHAKVVIKLRVE